MNFDIKFIPLLLSILFIFIMAFSPSNFLNVQKINMGEFLNHFIAFFTLSFLLYFSNIYLSIKKQILFLIFIGIFIEIVQFFIPSRGFEIKDFIVDIVAIFSFYSTIFLLRINNCE